MKITVDGVTVTIHKGQTVAAALIAAGVHSWSGRNVFCGIGTCHNCLLPPLNVRACQHVPDAPQEVITPAAQVVVLGGGPAGIAAAEAATRNGAQVLLIDSAPLLGGQYGRQAFDNEYVGLQRVHHLPNTVVWAIEQITDGQRLHLRTGPADAPDRTATVVDTGALILATGAYDRAIPFPGWNLPGVYTAGAAQALAKGQRVAVGRRVLLAGTGPFLLPVAESLLKVGAQVLGVLEANSPSGWLRGPRGAFSGRGKAIELAGYVAMLAKHGIPYRPRTTVVAAHGEDRVTSATTAKLDQDWNIVPGSTRRVDVDAVCVGFGFVPQVELAVAAGCATNADGFVTLDHAQRTSMPGVFAAGEITGIGGADLSAAEGEVAGAAAARGEVPHRSLKTVRRGHRFASALAAAHPIRLGWHGWLSADTVICRCEQVSYGALRAAIEQRQTHDSRPLKLVSRAGLGPCQGRMCGRAVAERPESPRPFAAPSRTHPIRRAGRNPVAPQGGQGMTQDRLDGVIVATALPYAQDSGAPAGLRPDLDRYAEHCRWLVDNGCRGVGPNGSLGEYSSLSDDERRAVARTAIEAVAGQGIVVVGAHQARHWAEVAAEDGADGVLCLPPTMYRANPAEVIHHFEQVASVGLPVMIYNNPIDTKVDLTPALVAELAAIDNVVAVKEFSGDVRRVLEIREAAPDLAVVAGADDVVLESLLMGATGWFAGFPNVFPAESAKLFSLARQGKLDEARALYEPLVAAFRWDSRVEFVQAIKHGMDVVGRFGGPCRPPRGPLSPEQLARLDADMCRAVDHLAAA